MTIFTVNLLNNNYIQQPFIKFCMNTWEKSGLEIKVFDFNSPEVKEAKEKYKTWIDSALNSKDVNKTAIASDPIRLYILSLYEDMLYLDTDMILMRADVLKQIALEKHFSIYGGSNFFCVHNGKDLQTPRKILERCYNTDKFTNDKNIVSSLKDLELKKIKDNYSLVHNPRIDNPLWHCRYSNNIEEIKNCTIPNTCFYVTNREVFKETHSGFNYGIVKNISKMPLEDRKVFMQFLENGNDYDNF